MNAKCRRLPLRGTFCLLLPFSLHPISSVVFQEHVSHSCFSAQPCPPPPSFLPPPPFRSHLSSTLLLYTRVICIHTGRRSHEGKTVLVFISGPYKSPHSSAPALVLSDFKWRRLTGSPLAFRGMSSLQPCDRPPGPAFSFCDDGGVYYLRRVAFSYFLRLLAHAISMSIGCRDHPDFLPSNVCP